MSCLLFKTLLESRKTSYSYNDFKRRMITLSCSEKTIGIIKRNNNELFLNCLHSFRTKTKLESNKKVCENKDFCNIVIPSEDTRILKFNEYKKFDKPPFIIFADLGCFIEKIDGCKNNPQNSSAANVGELILSGFLMPTK